MIAKPLNIALVFFLSMINFCIIIIPVAFIISPALFISSDLLLNYWFEIIMLLAFATSFLMVLYVILDSIFGFTVKRMTKKHLPYEKVTTLIAFRDFDLAFKETKRRFGKDKVRLFIDQRYEVSNAYAVGSFFRKRIVVTMGLLQQIYENSRDDSQYIDAVKGILGHEMSHLINKDFLPALLLSANKTASHNLFFFIRLLFNLLIRIFSKIPIVGHTLATLVVSVHNAFFSLIDLFLRWIIMPVYNFVNKRFSRSIEYRCDRESAYAFGSHRITTALSMLGKSSYITIFSSHPKNKSRIAKVKNIKAKAGVVKPTIISRATNLSAMLIMIMVCHLFYKAINFDNFDSNFKKQVTNPIEDKFVKNLNKIKSGINEIYLKIRN